MNVNEREEAIIVQADGVGASCNREVGEVKEGPAGRPGDENSKAVSDFQFEWELWKGVVVGYHRVNDGRRVPGFHFRVSGPVFGAGLCILAGVWWLYQVKLQEERYYSAVNTKPYEGMRNW